MYFFNTKQVQTKAMRDGIELEVRPYLTSPAGLGWSSIKHLLVVRDVTELYKIVNGLKPSYLNCYISKRTGIHSYNTRFWGNLDVPMRRVATAQRSFHYRSRTGSLVIIPVRSLNNNNNNNNNNNI